MQIGTADRVRMERAHVRAWPALRTDSIDGWLWRCSGGGSQRANSVSTVDFHGSDVRTAMAAVEAAYAAEGRPARFQTYNDTQPPGLESRLRERGYQPAEPTTTMFRRIGTGTVPDGIQLQDSRWPGWLDIYLGTVTPDRRVANGAILDAVPQPCGFLGACHEGKVVATALCVVGLGCAVIECVATGSAFRRQGFSRAVVTAALAWGAEQGVDLAGLQVAAGNVAAQRLYASLGFVAGASNRFWMLPGTGSAANQKTGA